MTRPADTTTAPPSGQRRRVPAKLIVAVVLLAIALTFILQNRDAVDIRLAVVTVSAPLWAALVCMLVLGGLVVYLLTRRGRKSSRH